MKRFVAGADRLQSTLLPECLDDFIDESNPVRAIDAFVDALDLTELGFDGVEPAATGRPSYHPSVLLKLYIYGYLNRVQSSRRLEREAGRNVEVMWLLGRLVPDHKTIADFRKDNAAALRQVCARFVELCRRMGLLTTTSVAIDGSKFKAVNNRDRNFTRAKVERRRAQLEESVARYLSQLDTADRQEPTEALAVKATRLKEKLAGKQDFVYLAGEDVYRCPAGERLTYRYTNEEAGKVLRRYWTTACSKCPLKPHCTTGPERRIARWEHEHLLDAVQQRLDANPQAMRQRRETVEHPFGTMKARMGATHFLMKTLPKVAAVSIADLV
jgi:transposase